MTEQEERLAKASDADGATVIMLDEGFPKRSFGLSLTWMRGGVEHRHAVRVTAMGDTPEAEAAAVKAQRQWAVLKGILAA